MNEELRAQMASLRVIAPMLNKATEEATTTVRTVEAFLKQLSLGIEGRSDLFMGGLVTFEEACDLPGRDLAECLAEGYIARKSSHLAYGRLRGEFSIHVVDVIEIQEPPEVRIKRGVGDEWDHDFEDDIVTAWSSCSRETKLKAVTFLPNLLANIELRASALARAANDATGFTRRVMESLDIAPYDPAVDPAVIRMNDEAKETPKPVPPVRRKNSATKVSKS
jgi:hypothetical protein